jgi:UDP-2-acetamido-3-amino-2,3-dideoxy-glucuronate N-acetyltransferase
MSLPKVAVVGCGYWGKNLVRVMYELGALEIVHDVRPEALDAMRAAYNVKTSPNLAGLMDHPEVQGVLIAAPAVNHYRLAKTALEAGKDVYVEKPLALHSAEGQELVEVAAALGRILMVGHILEYHPALVKLKELVQQGELGKLLYMYSSRMNLGKLRAEENILWSFAPHDISAMLSLLGELPERVSAHGGFFLNSKIADTTLTSCDFKSGVKAHIFVSWLHPFKEQKLALVGDRKMAVFDDLEKDRKLVLYAHRIQWRDRAPFAEKDGGEVVPLPELEPLKEECRHFLECIRTRSRPRTDGSSAARVLQVLEACEESLHQEGQPVAVLPPTRKYSAHPTAVIDEPCQIGEGTRIWHFSHIMSGSKLGRECNLGQNVVISPGVVIGDNVKIQNNVSVYTGVELQNDVFCGPSMVFTNVINPRSHIIRRDQYKRTLVKRGASLGANCTVVCGITVGEYAFVAAGAVANRDVLDYALVAGVPARQIGWMCYCGTRLAESRGDRMCSACGREYRVQDGICARVSRRKTEALEAAAATGA